MKTKNALETPAPAAGAAHTAGPWQAIGPNVFPNYDGSAFHDPVHRAAFGGHYDKRRTVEEVHANARLIAAAPDLLAACRGFVETLEMLGPIQRSAFFQDWQAVTAAIARATTGEKGKGAGK